MADGMVEDSVEEGGDGGDPGGKYVYSIIRNDRLFSVKLPLRTVQRPEESVIAGSEPLPPISER